METGKLSHHSVAQPHDLVLPAGSKKILDVECDLIKCRGCRFAEKRGCARFVEHVSACPRELTRYLETYEPGAEF